MCAVVRAQMVQGGIVGILIIAWVTDHCCKLLVHCKNHFDDAAYRLAPPALPPPPDSSLHL
jgi:hypothetical protein